MTQKEALKNIIETFEDKKLAYAFVFKWLEDINWHSENTLLSEKLDKYEMQYLDNLEVVYMATHEGEYSHDFVKKLIADDLELQKVKAKFEDDNSEGYFNYRGNSFSRVKLYDYAKTNYYKAFNYIFGWGMDASDWGSTSGQAFVDEIVEIIEPIFKEKEEKEEAYRRAYSD
jgi:hypothetical protein